MGTNLLCHFPRIQNPLPPLPHFGQQRVTSLSDSKYREILAVDKDEKDNRRLEETSRRLASALDQVMEVIAILDAGDGSIIYSNTLFSQIFGPPGHPVLNQKFSDLCECRSLTTALEQARSGQPWTGRSSLKTSSGRRITFEGTVSPVRTQEGGIESLVVRLRDITLEAEKDRHIRQAQKMDALGALAGGMAHGFNNLIGAILNAAELIASQTEPESPVLKKLDIIQRAGGRAMELSAQILNFSRRTEDTWSPFDLTHLVEEVISLLQATLPKNVELRCDLARGIRILGDPSQMHQVVMNLAINASQAMQPRGGVLSIQLKHVEAGRRWLDHSHPSPSVLLTIEDTGCGMEPKTLERIFEPFFTTKAVGQGTGLGLSVVYGIVQGHAGELQVSSEPGKGSSFRIRLPLHQDMHKGVGDRVAESRSGSYL